MLRDMRHVYYMVRQSREIKRRGVMADRHGRLPYRESAKKKQTECRKGREAAEENERGKFEPSKARLCMCTKAPCMPRAESSWVPGDDVARFLTHALTCQGVWFVS